MAQERGLDLAGLHAVAADLDLLVVATQELDLGRTIGVDHPAGQVAGAVQALARGGRERVGHELLCRGLGATQVTAGQAGTGQTQFTDHTQGGQAPQRIEHIGPVVGQRHTDGQGCGQIARIRHHKGRGVDAGLGGPVHVDDLRARQALLQAPRQRPGEHLATEHQAFQAPVAPLLGQRHQRLADRVEERGHRVDVGDRVAREQVPESLGLQRLQGRRDHDGRAAQERQQKLTDGDIKAHRDGRQNAVTRADGVVVGLACVAEIDRGAVGYSDRLGLAGGAGGVDHVGQGLGRDIALGQGPVGRGNRIG